MQPRERDYAYAGSFYAFAIWCGLGVAGIAEGLKKLLHSETTGISLSCLCLLIPIQMAGQTWDDHDRSGRYTCRDFGQNYLQTLDQSNYPIIFTNGDNDTFPLWYCVETEGIRTDTRVCNLSYLQTDWYIDQMKRPAYESPAVPIHWKRLQYVAGTREGIPVRPGTLEQVMDYYKDDPEMQREMLGDNPYELSNIIDRWVLNSNPDLQIFPTDSIVVTVDKEAVRRSGMMIAGDSIPDVMHISLKGKRAVYKSEMMMYEMLVQCNWERPLYVAVTVGRDNYGSLGDNFVQEGLAYRITPFNTKETGKTLDSEKMYDNLMNRFRFGGLDNPDIYLDETVTRMCYTHRRMFSQLATQLMNEGKVDSAFNVVRYVDKVIPPTTIPHNYSSGSLDLAKVWERLGQKAEVEKITVPLADNAAEYVEWYLSLPLRTYLINHEECMVYMYQLHNAADILQRVGSDKAIDYVLKLNELNTVLRKRIYGDSQPQETPALDVEEEEKEAEE